jgi:endonuclease G
MLKFLFVLIPSFVFAQTWLPDERTPSEIINHSAITIGYNEWHEVPQWVGYVLRREHLQDCVGRTNNFKVDPILRTGSSSPDDYKNSGYDRGHLAPAGDMKWSKSAMNESFYMSNITPQSPGMNRGKWAQLETLVRAWAKEADETLILSGPILKDGLPRIGRNAVSVPEEHFKVILRAKNRENKSIGFLMTKNPTIQGLEGYALSVREIEKLTGLNFFPHLSQNEQDKIERQIDWSAWNFKAKFSYDRCSI